MQVILVLFALFVVALSAPNGLTLEQKAMKCQEPGPIDKDLMKKMFRGIFTEDDNFKNYVLCMLKFEDLITADGKLNEEHMKSVWAKRYNGDLQEKLNKCLVNKDTPVETSWALMKCLYTVQEQLNVFCTVIEHEHYVGCGL
ncbi:unnamed protein product [Brassicogethes aeneus]|uniref:Uncharacterized protein n=1 Tax=Brassicogethes aeneus TaxID=1431903 RepID=A0A9P0FH52_BRAAE|nr:unnamed protein product [Brassicogethes aeneus]